MGFGSFYLPAQHQDGGLRIRSRGFDERGTVDHSEAIDAGHSVVFVDHFADVSAAVVVPDRDHGVPAELLHAGSVVGVLGDHVQVGLDAHVQQRRHRVLAVSGELRDVARAHDPLDRAYPAHAPPQVAQVAEVVEGHGRGGVDFGVDEAELAGGEWAVDLFQDEAAAEGFPGEVPLVPGVPLGGL